MSDDLFSRSRPAASAPPPSGNAPAAPSNVPELSVSELAFSLKRTLEETYSRVRVRGELSRVKIHSSGHLYSDLKDTDAVLNIICWKGTVAKLSLKPEEGLEVVCTGRISSYPARSNYQMIVESMELAGEGALLKMLEDRRKRLAAEGLFESDRKQPLPFLPQTIGVITSPTGAVIRDIMHRLNDRMPRHVLLWPVAVQGTGAAEQVAAAIKGFDSIPSNGKIPRPDILIVARGGGSLEDLMPFNEEIVVRAAADCRIPLISAVGHETDTTLIDYAADRRAPTPTAAAEMAVPQRLDLLATLQERHQRLSLSVLSRLREGQQRLETLHARLGDPAHLMENRTQAVDMAAQRLSAAFERHLNRRAILVADVGRRLPDPLRTINLKRERLVQTIHNGDRAFDNILRTRQLAVGQWEGRLRHPRTRIQEAERTLTLWSDRLNAQPLRLLPPRHERLVYLSNILETLSYRNILKRGFVLVSDESGNAVKDATTLRPAQKVHLHFAEDWHVEAAITTAPQQKKP